MDSQAWQEVVALSIVALTAALLLWSKFRKRKFKLPCNTDCGCSGSAPKGSITLQGRRGETPQITVKMK